MIRHALALATFVIVPLLSTTASAHIALTNPPARYGQDAQKDFPCGEIGNPPGTNAPTELVAGEPLDVSWSEFIDHDSHFRISISNVGDDAFLNPTSFEDFYNSDTVVLDEIVDQPGLESHGAEIMVPDIACNPCTLQLMQVMYGGTFGEGSLYYQCADIVIVGGMAGTTSGGESSTGPTDESSGGMDSSSDGGGSMTASGSASATTTAGESSTGEAESGMTLAEETSSATGPANDESSGCGCSTDRESPAVALLVIVLPLLRRRR